MAHEKKQDAMLFTHIFSYLDSQTFLLMVIKVL